jgi:hypothetical protein
MTSRYLFDNKKISGDLSSSRDLSLPPLSFVQIYSLSQRACVVAPPYLAQADESLLAGLTTRERLSS